MEVTKESKVEQLQKEVQAEKVIREQSFIKELEELCKKYNCALGAKALINEEGKIVAQPVVVAK